MSVGVESPLHSLSYESAAGHLAQNLPNRKIARDCESRVPHSVRYSRPIPSPPPAPPSTPASPCNAPQSEHSLLPPACRLADVVGRRHLRSECHRERRSHHLPATPHASPDCPPPPKSPPHRCPAPDRRSAPIADATACSGVGSSRVDLQACKLEYSIVSPK